MPKTPTKEVSVMAWIEDPSNGVLLVRQAAGFKFWTLPGGKVKVVNHWSKHSKERSVKKRDSVSRWAVF
jgi:ADP-ribose pyrophosphatase YjhB (NUDIX family)